MQKRVEALLPLLGSNRKEKETQFTILYIGALCKIGFGKMVPLLTSLKTCVLEY